MEDNNIFKNGWNKVNAYIFGWIMSDGCLKKEGRNKNRHAVRITSNDKEIIEWMHGVMCVGNRIYVQGKNYSIKYRNLDGIAFMIEHNLKERKSLDMQFPLIPDEYLPFFIRGYFDGDGSVVLRETKYNTYGQISFTSGSLEFLESLQNKLGSFGIDSRIYPDGRVGNNCSYLRVIKRSEIEKLFFFLYADEGSKRLERKYIRFKSLMDSKPKYNISWNA